MRSIDTKNNNSTTLLVLIVGFQKIIFCEVTAQIQGFIFQILAIYIIPARHNLVLFFWNMPPSVQFYTVLSYELLIRH